VPCAVIRSAAVHFNCPNCNALYQIVKVEAGPETVDTQITCRVCGAPFSGREDGLVLKYFLLRKAARVDLRARGISQRARPKNAQ
jgi:predicted RNA-binding Zn-ribbon protein involved in translation (DUF1610 family)